MGETDDQNPDTLKKGQRDSATARQEARGSREEAINTILAGVLTEEHNLRTVPEQRVHGRSKTPDLTIRPTLDCPHTVFGEAKFGTTSAAKQAAAKQARAWTDQPQNAPRRLAFGLCYPDDIKGDLTPPEIAAYLRQTQGLEWAFAGASGEAWRRGGVATLATEIRNVSDRRGDIETLLTGIIVESANIWVSHRKVATKSRRNLVRCPASPGGSERDGEESVNETLGANPFRRLQADI